MIPDDPDFAEEESAEGEEDQSEECPKLVDAKEAAKEEG